MTISEHIHITIAIETFQLPFHPLKLRIVQRNIGIKRDDKRIAIAKGIGRITGQPSRGAIRRNELRDGGKIITQTILPSGIIQLRCRRDIVITGREKIWDAAFSG
ncbi:MAG: hypothetical protein ALAOOOJD_03377 [bacterium]|nr:hypothetical protein [bacterium]